MAVITNVFTCQSFLCFFSWENQRLCDDHPKPNIGSQVTQRLSSSQLWASTTCLRCSLGPLYISVLKESECQRSGDLEMLPNSLHLELSYHKLFSAENQTQWAPTPPPLMYMLAHLSMLNYGCGLSELAPQSPFSLLNSGQWTIPYIWARAYM